MDSSVQQQIIRFNLLFKRYDDIYRSAAKKFDMPELSLWILYTLREKSECTQKDLVDLLLQPKQSIHTALKALVRDGYVVLECPENNGIHYREGGHGFLEIDWRTLIDYYDMCYRNRKEKISAVYFPKDWKEDEDRFDWKNIRLHYGWHYPHQETGSE